MIRLLFETVDSLARKPQKQMILPLSAKCRLDFHDFNNRHFEIKGDEYIICRKCHQIQVLVFDSFIPANDLPDEIINLLVKKISSVCVEKSRSEAK